MTRSAERRTEDREPSKPARFQNRLRGGRLPSINQQRLEGRGFVFFAFPLTTDLAETEGA